MGQFTQVGWGEWLADKWVRFAYFLLGDLVSLVFLGGIAPFFVLQRRILSTHAGFTRGGRFRWPTQGKGGSRNDSKPTRRMRFSLIVADCHRKSFYFGQRTCNLQRFDGNFGGIAVLISHHAVGHQSSPKQSLSLPFIRRNRGGIISQYLVCY